MSSEIVRFNKKSPITKQGTYQLNVDNTVKTWAADVTPPAGANYCAVRVEKSDSTTGPVVLRYMYEGTAPTAAYGIPVANLDVLVFTIDMWSSLQFISVDTNAQQLWFQWFKV